MRLTFAADHSVGAGHGAVQDELAMRVLIYVLVFAALAVLPLGFSPLTVMPISTWFAGCGALGGLLAGLTYRAPKEPLRWGGQCAGLSLVIWPRWLPNEMLTFEYVLPTLTDLATQLIWTASFGAFLGWLASHWVRYGAMGGAFTVWAFDRQVSSHDPSWSDPAILHWKLLALAAAFLVGFAVVAGITLLFSGLKRLFALGGRPVACLVLPPIRLPVSGFATRSKVLFAGLAGLSIVTLALTERPADHIRGAWALLVGVDDTDVEVAFRAAESGEVAAITRSLRRGVSANVRSGQGDPLLYVAVINGNAATAQELLRFGAVPDRQRRVGHATPLHAAVRLCRVDLVKLLVSAGAHPCIADGSGAFPVSRLSGCSEALPLLQIFTSMDALTPACKGRPQPNPFDVFDDG
jgi:hypothetical protein